LLRIVELLWLGEMGDIAGVKHESGLCPNSADLGDRFLQRAERVGIGRLVEADMAVRYLDEGKAGRGRLRLADDLRCWNASRQRPHEPGPALHHAFERFPAVDSAKFFTVHLRLLLPAERRSWGRLRKEWVYSRVIRAI
jgi:hypothetical protein